MIARSARAVQSWTRHVGHRFDIAFIAAAAALVLVVLVVLWAY